MANATLTKSDLGYPTSQQKSPIAADANLVVAAASGSAATVTIAAPATGSGLSVVIDRVDFSYGVATSTGLLTITDGTTTWAVHAVEAGNRFVELGLVFAKETSVTVTLADGSQAKKLNVRAYLIQ